MCMPLYYLLHPIPDTQISSTATYHTVFVDVTMCLLTTFFIVDLILNIGPILLVVSEF